MSSLCKSMKVGTLEEEYTGSELMSSTLDMLSLKCYCISGLGYPVSNWENWATAQEKYESAFFHIHWFLVPSNIRGVCQKNSSNSSSDDDDKC